MHQHVIEKREVRVRRLHCKVLALTPKAEHSCMAGYAGAEVFGFHAALWWLSILLVVFYFGSVTYGYLSGHSEDE